MRCSSISVPLPAKRAGVLLIAAAALACSSSGTAPEGPSASLVVPAAQFHAADTFTVSLRNHSDERIMFDKPTMRVQRRAGPAWLQYAGGIHNEDLPWVGTPGQVYVWVGQGERGEAAVPLSATLQPGEYRLIITFYTPTREGVAFTATSDRFVIVD